MLRYGKTVSVPLLLFLLSPLPCVVCGFSVLSPVRGIHPLFSDGMMHDKKEVTFILFSDDK